MMLGHTRIIDAEPVSDSRFDNFRAGVGPIGKLARTVHVSVQVPLSRMASNIASVSQSLGNRVFAPRISVVAIVLESEAILIAATQKASPRWPTLGGSYISGCEKRTHAGETIRVRRFHIVADTDGAEISPAMVIGENDNDVWSGGYGLSDC